MKHIWKGKCRRIVTTGILGLALMSLVPLGAQAFGRGGKHRPDPDRALARLSEQLDLTSAQEEQVKTILEASFAKQAEVRDAHRSEMDTLRDETHGALAAVLTPEQVEKLDQLREERQEKRERRGDCDGRPDRWNDGADSGE